MVGEFMIDIIIPTYNSNNTLADTLESIIKQVDIPKICVYIVDDGSECDYSDIIDKYKDKIDIFFKKNVENKGPGYARNDALSISNGEYIIFIDSDDVFYSNNSISTLYNSIVSTNSDIVTSVIIQEGIDNNNIFSNDLIGSFKTFENII